MPGLRCRRSTQYPTASQAELFVDEQPPSLEYTPFPEGAIRRWCRPGRGEELCDHTPVCLFNRIHPADVLQGHLGDCWLLAAMSALAESPELVRNLFAQKEVDEAGRYDIRLFAPVKNKPSL